MVSETSVRNPDRNICLAVETDPDHAGAQLALADLLVETGSEVRAADHYRRYLELNPQAEDAEALRLLIAALGAPAESGEAASVQPDALFDVVLVEYGEDKEAVVRVVALAGGLEPLAARAVVESSPVSIEHAVPREVAEVLVEELEEVGATGNMKPSGTWGGTEKLTRLAPNQIDATILKREGKVIACLKKKSGLTGGDYSLTVAFLIQRNGKVKSAEFKGPRAMVGSPAAKCVLNQLKRLRFPKNDVASRIDRHLLGPYSVP